MTIEITKEMVERARRHLGALVVSDGDIRAALKAAFPLIERPTASAREADEGTEEGLRRGFAVAREWAYVDDGVIFWETAEAELESAVESLDAPTTSAISAISVAKSTKPTASEVSDLGLVRQWALSHEGLLPCDALAELESIVGNIHVPVASEEREPASKLTAGVDCDSDGNPWMGRALLAESRLRELETELAQARERAALAGVEGGTLVADDLDRYARELVCKYHGMDYGYGDYAEKKARMKAALQFTSGRLAPSAREVTAEDAEVVARELSLSHPGASIGVSETLYTLLSVFATRPTAERQLSCNKEPAQPVNDALLDRAAEVGAEMVARIREPAQPVEVADVEHIRIGVAGAVKLAPLPREWLKTLLAEHDRLASELAKEREPAQPAEVADALTAEIEDIRKRMTAARARGYWSVEASDVEQVIAAHDRLAGELAKERERVARTEQRVKETMQAAGEAESELAQLRERAAGYQRDLLEGEREQKRLRQTVNGQQEEIRQLRERVRQIEGAIDTAIVSETELAWLRERVRGVLRLMKASPAYSSVTSGDTCRVWAGKLDAALNGEMS